MQGSEQIRRGRLLQGDGPIFGNRVFYVTDNVRHWIMDAEWCGENGFSWPDDVQKVSDTDLVCIPLGRPAARKWNVDKQANQLAENQLQMRAIAASFLHGSGIEFGAASNPLPIPLACRVEYADVLTYEELLGRLYPGQSAENMVKPRIQASIDDLSNISEGVDFIASAHVIEHIRDPIGAIVHAAGKLRPGGQMLLFVPDMTQTFDCARPLTTLNHLILDFYSASEERDRVHFQEFYRVAFTTPPERYEATWTKAWQDRFPIHYHTWTYESFRSMIEWIIASSHVYKGYWSHPTRGNEFCFVLQK